MFDTPTWCAYITRWNFSDRFTGIEQKKLSQDFGQASGLGASAFLAAAGIPHLWHNGRSSTPTWKSLRSTRDIRHVLQTRTDAHAEEEVRIVANRIGEIMAERMPYFFQDFTLEPHNTGPPAWVALYEKV